MVASPNYMFGIYDGDNSGGTAAPGFIPAGSAQIEDVFEKFYANRGEPSQDSEFSGRSDYGPFIAVGIPAGGLFTGAEVPKTAAEEALVRRRGRRAVRPVLPPAVRQPDRRRARTSRSTTSCVRTTTLVGNINMHALDVNSDAIATAVLTFAYDTSTVNGEPGAPRQGSGQGPEGAEGGQGRGRTLSRLRRDRGPRTCGRRSVRAQSAAGTIRRSRTAPSPSAANASW